MAKQLESLSIHPGENGGHRIVHSFKRQAVSHQGRMNAGLSMERPDNEEHNFGPEEQQQHKIMTHIAGALGFKKVAQAEGKEDAHMAEAPGVETEED